MKTELLAPAKNLTIAKIAIDSGADAVYIGADAFGARHNALNSISDIKELVEYAHQFYVKVYVTVNTIIKDTEIQQVKKLINELYEIGVDALIIQDFAILKWATEGQIPPIPLHMSTQCNNKDIDKIKFFENIGAPRVVLARELSLNQISKIAKTCPSIELETFIHGALCVSYSGQCYLSCFIGGRSANRGECAQPCRKKYSLIDQDNNIIAKDKHLLSLKDLNTTDIIDKLVKIGVCSFKIEGRLKDELYVKNVVGHYRMLLDKISAKSSSGRVSLGFTPDVNKTFNRDYTTYFLEERGDCFNFNSPKFVGEKLGTVKTVSNNWIEISFERKIKLNKQDGLCFTKTAQSGALINKIEGGKIYLSTTVGIKKGMEVYRNSDSEFETILKKTAPKRQIGVNIEIKDNIIFAKDEDNNTVTLRITESEAPKNPVLAKESLIKGFSKTKESDYYINSFEINSKVPFLKISAINEYRRRLFNLLTQERIKNYPKLHHTKLKYANYHKPEVDYKENIHNEDAKEYLQKSNATVTQMSFESSRLNSQVELMRMKHCLKYAFKMCKSNKDLFLIDEKGVKYPLIFDCQSCEMAVLSPV